MSSVPEDGNRFAPPQAHVEDIETGAGQLATRWQRLCGAMIDGGIGLLLVGLLALLTPINAFKTPPGGMTPARLALLLVIGLVSFTLIHGYLLATRGQTVGKALLGLRIVRSNGEAASFGRLLGLRYAIGTIVGVIPVLGQIYGVVDALLIFRAPRRCLHDLIADTIVIKL